MTPAQMAEAQKLAREAKPTTQPTEQLKPRPELRHTEPPGNDFNQYLTEMLRQLRSQQSNAPSSDPRIKRLELFLIDFCEFFQNPATDDESRRLESEINWLKANYSSFPWPGPLPLTAFDTFKQLLLNHTPRYKQMIAEFMEAHTSYMTSRQGDKRKLSQQIDTLVRAGLLTDEQGALFRSTYVLQS
jgi:hypothetical protein